MAKFTDIFEDVTKQGTKIPTNLYLETGMYPIIDQGQSQVAGYTNETEGVFTDIPAIIFGDHTRIIKYVYAPCFLGADGVKLLKARDDNANYKYLYYALCSADIPNTGYNRHFKWLKEIDIQEYPIEEQNRIVAQLEKIDTLIFLRKQQLSKLDELVKSRFIEMFGDPKTNPNSFDIVSFNECVEYMGDIGSNGANQVVVDHLDMKDEEDYALMVRFLNFTKNDFTADVKYISKESYEFFKKSQIFGGELIICKIGSAGQNYVMPYLNRPVSLGLNQIMVRINEKTLMPYLYRYINSDYGKQLISGCINGAVTKSITKTELKKIPVMIPPMELQNEFVAFIEQIDKSKFEIKKSLEKLETLKKALMQQYFG